jgi:hypothetical protein
LDPDVRKVISKIVGVYAINRASCTHCCEITPSYLCCAVSNEVYYNDDPDEDALRERRLETAEDFVRSVNMQDSWHYQHVRTVDRYIELNPKLCYRVGVVDEDGDMTDSEIIDKLFEIWSSNPKF